MGARHVWAALRCSHRPIRTTPRVRQKDTPHKRSLTPVFNLKPLHARHVVEVCRDQRGTTRKSMRRDRRIEILDSGTAALESGLDAAVCLADGVRPLRTRKLGTNQIETRLQGLSTLG